MAYQIYRPGNTHIVRHRVGDEFVETVCELKNVDGEGMYIHLADGWYKTPGEWDQQENSEEGFAKSDPNHPVRVQAKEAGIEGWDTKRIATLEAELDGAQE